MTEHRGISAAEKYAELEKAGASRPRCSCHGEEKYWCRRPDRPSGGFWQTCPVSLREKANHRQKCNPERTRETTRSYRKANPEKRREFNRNYQKKKRLLRLLPDRLWLVEESWPKHVAIARLSLGGTTEAERETAKKKLALILKKEKMEWVNPLIISCAMQTTRLVMSFPLSLESSREG